LFERFARDLAQTPKQADGWLYNYDSVKDEPADLDYWIGAEICRSYYAHATDKAAAIRKIVTLTDIAGIVKNSQYAYLLDKKWAGKRGIDRSVWLRLRGVSSRDRRKQSDGRVPGGNRP
jgi:hypothetical protein